MDESSIPNNNNSLISISAAAGRFNVTGDYISRLCRQNKVDGELVGGVWKVNEVSLARYFEAQREAQKTRTEELSKQLRDEYLQHKKEHEKTSVFASRAQHFSAATALLVAAVALYSWTAVAYSVWGEFNAPRTFAVQTAPLVPDVAPAPIPVTPRDLQAAIVQAAPASLHTLKFARLKYEAPDFDTALAVANENISTANRTLFSVYADIGKLALDAAQSFLAQTYVLRDLSTGFYLTTGIIFNTSVGELADAGTKVAHEEFNTANVWDAWTGFLSNTLYPRACSGG